MRRSAQPPRRLPVVLSGDEVLAVVRQLSGAKQLVAMLLYGSGLRLLEALTLRVKDVDFAREQLIIRSGKGDKDRVSVFPPSMHERLRQQLVRVKRLHERDLALARVTSCCRVRCGGSGLARRARGNGSGCFRRRRCIAIRRRENAGGTICTRPRCSGA